MKRAHSIGSVIPVLVLLGAGVFSGCLPTSMPSKPAVQAPGCSWIPACAGCNFTKSSSLASGTMTWFPHNYTLAAVGRNRNVLGASWTSEQVSLPQVQVLFNDGVHPLLTVANAEMDFYYPIGTVYVCEYSGLNVH